MERLPARIYNILYNVCQSIDKGEYLGTAACFVEARHQLKNVLPNAILEELNAAKDQEVPEEKEKTQAFPFK